MPSLPRFKYGKEEPVMGFFANKHRGHVTAFLAELAGTFLFLFFSFAIAQVANTPAPSDDDNTPGAGLPSIPKIFFIASGFGASVAINVWLFYRVSGGMFNPAVTLALWLIGAVPSLRCCVVFLAQIAGGIAAAGAVSGTLPGPMAVNVRLGGGTSIARGLFIEMFATCQLTFAVIMLAAVKHKATYLAPIGIGIALFIGHLLSIYYTGAGINPARAFGPDVVTGDFPGYHWIYWLGPVMGASLSAGFFYLMVLLKWDDCNPGQDYDDLETQMVNPRKKAIRPNVAHMAPPSQNPSPLLAEALGGEKHLVAGDYPGSDARTSHASNGSTTLGDYPRGGMVNGMVNGRGSTGTG